MAGKKFQQLICFLPTRRLIHKGRCSRFTAKLLARGWRESPCERSEPGERVGSEREPAEPLMNKLLGSWGPASAQVEQEDCQEGQEG